jgi:DNA replicative helicase MCM subunit Mcm2 (Cdc46/Mcm family)
MTREKFYLNDGPEEAARKYHAATKRLVIEQLSVSQALRTDLEHFIVVGQIATVASIYNMVSSINLKCSACNNERHIDYRKKPRITVPKGDSFTCDSCKNEEAAIIVTPEWIPALDIQLQDTEKFNNIERLTVKLFGKDTNDIRAGEIVSVKGYRDVTRRNEANNSGRHVTVFYSESIDYNRKNKIEVSQKDIKNMERWKNEVIKQDKNIIDLLVEKYCPTVTGHEFVKKSILLALANAGIRNDENRDPRRLRIHVLAVGDPGQAKSTMIRKASELIDNGRFESAVGSSGIGLTFTVTKEPNESHVLRLGAIPLASGSTCGINEINQTPLEQQKHYFDFMEEGRSTSGKYAIPATIEGHTSIIASANPRQGRWKDQDSEMVQLDDINLVPQVLDRFDIICVLKQGRPNEQKDRDYIARKREIRKNLKAGAYDEYDEHLRKYLKYARTFNPNPEISEEALNMLDEYWIKMGQTQTDGDDDRGRPRKLEALYRMAVAISKLKLKNEADIDDAIETMKHYNVVLLHFSKLVPVSQSPKEIARETCIDILREMSPYSISFTPDLINTACERKEQIRAYLGDDLHIRSNWKLREIYEALLYNSHVKLVKEKPVVFMWQGKEKEKEQEQTKAKASKQACDECDACEDPGPGGHTYQEDHAQNDGKNDEKGAPDPTPSHTSHTSHSVSNEDKAAMLKEYDRLSALSRKNSKAAGQTKK